MHAPLVWPALPLAMQQPVRLAAFDVGIVHLGLAVCEGSCVTHASLNDLTCMPHRRVPRAACTLGHTCMLVDRVAHFLQEIEPYLLRCDAALVEQQPPGGHQAVEQLLVLGLRNLLGHERVHMVSPVSLHRFWGIRHLDYEGRKAALERALSKLEQQGRLQWAEGTCVQHLGRRHDVLDAVAMCWFYRSRQRRVAAALPAGPVCAPVHTIEALQRFRYKPHPQSTKSVPLVQPSAPTCGERCCADDGDDGV